MAAAKAIISPAGDMDASSPTLIVSSLANNVLIYSGATLLGPDAIVGDNVVIGGNVWLTTAVTANTKIAIARPELQFKRKKNNKTFD